MKFLAIAALLGAITAQEIFEADALEAIQRARVSENIKQVTCTRLAPKIAYALNKARLVPVSRPDEKAMGELATAATMLRTDCHYAGNHFVCKVGSVDKIQGLLRTAMSKTGKLSLRNSSSQLEYAYSSSEWAYIYSKRCLFSENERYVPTLLDVTVTPAGHQEIDADVAAINATLTRQGNAKFGKMSVLKADAEALGKTKEAQAWEVMEKRNWVTPGPLLKKFEADAKKVVADTKAAAEARPNGFHVENAKIPALKKEWAGLKVHAEKMETAPVTKEWVGHAKATFQTPEGKKFMQDAKVYMNSPQGAILKQKVATLKADMKKNIIVADKPAQQ